jgi:hypothetical protein
LRSFCLRSVVGTAWLKYCASIPTTAPEQTIAGVIGHEIEHDLNPININALKNRQEGKNVNENIETPSYEMQRKIFSEIQKQ